ASRRGGMGALTSAMAAAVKEAGAEIRTGVDVERILVRNGSAAGVVLRGGDEIAAKRVVSGADPQRTFLRLLDPGDLLPSFAAKVQNYRSKGTVAKLNLALNGLPTFTALRDFKGTAELAGRIQIGPGIDYLERAFDASKYGEFSPAPYLDISIPTILDPSLAPEGKHVMSIYMQFAPFHLKAGDWSHHSDALADTIVKTVAEYAPDLQSKILGGHIIT